MRAKVLILSLHFFSSCAGGFRSSNGRGWSQAQLHAWGVEGLSVASGKKGSVAVEEAIMRHEKGQWVGWMKVEKGERQA